MAEYHITRLEHIPNTGTELMYPNNKDDDFSLKKEVEGKLGIPLQELVSFSTRKSGALDEIRGYSGKKSELAFGRGTGVEGGFVEAILYDNHHRAVEIPLPESILVEQAGGVVAVYNALNIKGVGFINPRNFESKKDNYYGSINSPTVVLAPSKEYDWGTHVLGMLDGRVAKTLIQESMFLQGLGGRAEGVAATFRLNSCFYEGELCSIEELVKIGVIDNEPYKDLGAFYPTELFRLLKNNVRVKDLNDETKRPEEKSRLLEDAFGQLMEEYFLLKNQYERLLQEDPQSKYLNSLKEQLDHMSPDYNINDTISMNEYLRHTAYWTGKNLGILHGNLKYMCFYNSGNVTLSLGEVVDLDSISKISRFSDDGDFDDKNVILKDASGKSYEFNSVSRVFLKDIRDASFTLRILISNIKKSTGSSIKRNMIFEQFKEGYERGLASAGKPKGTMMKVQNQLESYYNESTFNDFKDEVYTLASLIIKEDVPMKSVLSAEGTVM